MSDPADEYREYMREDASRLASEARLLRRSLWELTQGVGARRRRTTFVLAVFLFGGLMLADEHTEQCVVDGPNSEVAEFVCDVSFPAHDHSNDRHYVLGDNDGGNISRPDADFPLEGRLVGTVGYSVALIAGGWWAFRHRNGNTRHNPF